MSIEERLERIESAMAKHEKLLIGIKSQQLALLAALSKKIQSPNVGPDEIRKIFDEVHRKNMNRASEFLGVQEDTE